MWQGRSAGTGAEQLSAGVLNGFSLMSKSLYMKIDGCYGRSDMRSRMHLPDFQMSIKDVYSKSTGNTLHGVGRGLVSLGVN